MKALLLSSLFLSVVSTVHSNADVHPDLPSHLPIETAVTDQQITPAKATVIDTYTCNHGANTRIIEVLNYDDADVVCEVDYESAEGKKTLWDAKWDTKYCQTKARDFASKQVSWGWACTDTYGVVVDAAVPKTPVAEVREGYSKAE